MEVIHMSGVPACSGQRIFTSLYGNETVSVGKQASEPDVKVSGGNYSFGEDTIEAAPMTRQEALDDAAGFGMSGLLNEANEGRGIDYIPSDI